MVSTIAYPYKGDKGRPISAKFLRDLLDHPMDCVLLIPKNTLMGGAMHNRITKFWGYMALLSALTGCASLPRVTPKPHSSPHPSSSPVQAPSFPAEVPAWWHRLPANADRARADWHRQTQWVARGLYQTKGGRVLPIPQRRSGGPAGENRQAASGISPVSPLLIPLS